MYKRHIRWILLILVFLATTTSAQDTPLQVVTTTTIIADVAQNVGGNLVNVTALIPPDADSHAFQLTPRDLVLLTEADLVLVNGAGLETFLGTVLDEVLDANIIVVSHGVEILPFGATAHEHDDEVGDDHEDVHLGVLGVDADCSTDEHGDETQDDDEHEHGACDPHVWTDPHNVIIWAQNIASAFADADPANADTYHANADAYVAQLESLDSEIVAIVDGIPAENRVLVTNHEFFGYFAYRYGFEVIGVVIPGGSTLAEPDPRTIANLIDTINTENIPAIFAEISAHPRLAETVAAETGITVVTTLYSESLSDSDGPASTYIDYLRYNAQTIADALSD